MLWSTSQVVTNTVTLSGLFRYTALARQSRRMDVAGMVVALKVAITIAMPRQESNGTAVKI